MIFSFRPETPEVTKELRPSLSSFFSLCRVLSFRIDNSEYTGSFSALLRFRYNIFSFYFPADEMLVAYIFLNRKAASLFFVLSRSFFQTQVSLCLPRNGGN